jgi:hypothetical protein
LNNFDWHNDAKPIISSSVLVGTGSHRLYPGKYEYGAVL